MCVSVRLVRCVSATLRRARVGASERGRATRYCTELKSALWPHQRCNIREKHGQADGLRYINASAIRRSYAAATSDRPCVSQHCTCRKPRRFSMPTERPWTRKQPPTHLDKSLLRPAAHALVTAYSFYHSRLIQLMVKAFSVH